jgi:hypothetical protein
MFQPVFKVIRPFGRLGQNQQPVVTREGLSRNSEVVLEDHQVLRPSAQDTKDV